MDIERVPNNPKTMFHKQETFPSPFPSLSSSLPLEPSQSVFDQQILHPSNFQFAGRIGGNQEFTASPKTPGYQALLVKQPDAAPITRWRDLLDLQGFAQLDLWKQALIECWGTCLLVFLTGALAAGISNNPSTITPLGGALTAALASSVALTLFIFGAAPASGGHLNPTITIATFVAGLSTGARTVLYVCAQSIGAIVGGMLLRGALGGSFYFPQGVVPGCSTNPSLVSVGQMFVLEFLFDSITIFLAFGLGLDPRQGAALGPTLSPILIGLSLGLINLIAALAKPGYFGVSLNPARCLGLMAANYGHSGYMRRHYIHWLAPIAAGFWNGLLYYVAPPYKKIKRD